MLYKLCFPSIAYPLEKRNDFIVALLYETFFIFVRGVVYIIIYFAYTTCYVNFDNVWAKPSCLKNLIFSFQNQDAILQNHCFWRRYGAAASGLMLIPRPYYVTKGDMKTNAVPRGGEACRGSQQAASLTQPRR